MKIFKLSTGLMATLTVAFMACGPSANDGASVHVSTSEDSAAATATVPPETTVVVTPSSADTVTNTVIEQHTDTVVKVVPGRTDTVRTTSPGGSTVSAGERARIDGWLRSHADSLNQYGDPKGTVYTGGTPLFNESTGETINRYDYIVRQHPDRPWMMPTSVESTPRR